MEKSELRILMALREDARQSLTDISKKTKIPISTIYDKLKGFRSNYVKRYTSLVNFSLLGYNTQATIKIRVRREKRDELRDYLISSAYVNSLYKINNGYDFQIEAIFCHIKELEDFIEKLEERFLVKDPQVNYIIEDIMREKFMSDAVTHPLTTGEVASSNK